MAVLNAAAAVPVSLKFVLSVVPVTVAVATTLPTAVGVAVTDAVPETDVVEVLLENLMSVDV